MTTNNHKQAAYRPLPSFERVGDMVAIDWRDGRKGVYAESALVEIISNLKRLTDNYPDKDEWKRTLGVFQAGLEFLQGTESEDNHE